MTGAPLADSGATDGYCWATNASGSYSLAIRQMRLQGIREGRFEPREDDPEEMNAAKGGDNE